MLRLSTSVCVAVRLSFKYIHSLSTHGTTKSLCLCLFLSAISYQLFQPCLLSIHPIHLALLTGGFLPKDFATSGLESPKIRPAASFALGYGAEI